MALDNGSVQARIERSLAAHCGKTVVYRSDLSLRLAHALRCVVCYAMG